MAPRKPSLRSAHELGEADVAKLEQRQRLLIPLAAKQRLQRHEVEAAARELALSPRTVRHLIRCYRLSGEAPMNLAPRKRGRQKGTLTLDRQVEDLIGTAIAASFASSQRPKTRKLWRDIRLACRQRGLKPPSVNRPCSRMTIGAEN